MEFGILYLSWIRGNVFWEIRRWWNLHSFVSINDDNQRYHHLYYKVGRIWALCCEFWTAGSVTISKSNRVEKEYEQKAFKNHTGVTNERPGIKVCVLKMLRIVIQRLEREQHAGAFVVTHILLNIQLLLFSLQETTTFLQVKVHWLTISFHFTSHRSPFTILYAKNKKKNQVPTRTECTTPNPKGPIYFIGKLHRFVHQETYSNEKRANTMADNNSWVMNHLSEFPTLY